MRSLLVLALLLSACAPASQESSGETGLPLAYRLMDQRENARAIELLEKIVNEDPANAEARLCLATAYVGEAGLDVFAFHDAFQQLFFSRSLTDQLWSRGDEKGAPLAEVPPLAGGEAPLQDVLARVDQALGTLQKATMILNQFPAIPEEKRPLVEEAFELLEDMPASKDLSLYRLFIRVLYISDFIRREWVADPAFGTRTWLCRLDPSRFVEDAQWLTEHLKLAAEDASAVFGDRAPAIGKLEEILASVSDEIQPVQLPGVPQLCESGPDSDG